MAPRRRTTDNLTIATAACELLAGAGERAVTFAEVAKRCGLAPPTLIQRFGTRAGLLDAMAEALPRAVAQLFAPAGMEESGLDRLRRGLLASAPWQIAAAHLAPHARLDAYSAELRKQISFALSHAIAGGGLPRVDVARTARALQIVFAGAVAQALLEHTDPAVEIASAIGSYLADYI